MRFMIAMHPASRYVFWVNGCKAHPTMMMMKETCTVLPPVRRLARGVVRNDPLSSPTPLPVEMSPICQPGMFSIC